MTVFLGTFLVLLTVVALMAIGVIISDRRIQGSCGGIAAVPGVKATPCLCKNPCVKRLAREAEERRAGAASE